MNTATTTITLSEGYFARRNWFDWMFAAIVAAGGLYALQRYGAFMDVYEKGILLGAIPCTVWLGWFWRPLRTLMLAWRPSPCWPSASTSRTARQPRARGHGVRPQVLPLQPVRHPLDEHAVLHQHGLLLLGMFARGERGTLSLLGSRIAWVAIAMALIGTLVRWYESYLIGPDIGHIPVSNLYEVFVLFCWMTAAFYLYYEEQYATRALGGFVMLVVSAAVGFLLWYTVVREAHEIQPLVPALKSWWMKLHVPANFIGYGTFALAAMVAFAYLIKQQAGETRWWKLAPLWMLGVVLCFEPIVFRQGAAENGGSYWMVYFGISALIVAGILLGRRRIAERLPSFECSTT